MDFRRFRKFLNLRNCECQRCKLVVTPPQTLGNLAWRQLLQGRRTGRRVLPVEFGFKVEVSFEDKGKFLGQEGGNIGTYCSVPRADGTLSGEGHGVFITAEGETATWKGMGTGKLTGGGAVSYRGALIFTTTSQKLARLHAIAALFEFEVDAEGNTHSKFWEWK